MANKTALCEYADCDTQLPTIQMEEMRDDDNRLVYVCEPCTWRIEDPSGYCSFSCQLGYGCDQSC